MASDPISLDDDYARAGFGGHLPFGERPALLIVDVCSAYIDPASALYAKGEAALAANQRLVAVARDVGIPVIFTRVLYRRCQSPRKSCMNVGLSALRSETGGLDDTASQAKDFRR